MHARTHARTHACMHTYMHARTHARTHTHTHALTPFPRRKGFPVADSAYQTRDAHTHTRTHARTPARAQGLARGLAEDVYVVRKFLAAGESRVNFSMKKVVKMDTDFTQLRCRPRVGCVQLVL